MKIYTKTGDRGLTSLASGKRVPKHDEQVEAYGTLDELNALLGITSGYLSHPQAEILRTSVQRIQNELFDLGAEVAGYKKSTPVIQNHHITTLENEIDAFEKQLTPLRQFILPRGTSASSHFHLSRTVCRRAERWICRIDSKESLRPEVIQYVNRLSDWLFVAARFANNIEGVEDLFWKST